MKFYIGDKMLHILIRLSAFLFMFNLLFQFSDKYERAVAERQQIIKEENEVMHGKYLRI